MVFPLQTVLLRKKGKQTGIHHGANCCTDCFLSKKRRKKGKQTIFSVNVLAQIF